MGSAESAIDDRSKGAKKAYATVLRLPAVTLVP